MNNANRENLRELMMMYFRNQQYPTKPDQRLTRAQLKFVDQAIAKVLQVMGVTEVPEDIERDARETIGIWYGSQPEEELDAEQAEIRDRLQKHMDTIASIRADGLRVLRCAEYEWKAHNAEATIDRHLRDGVPARARPFPNWNDDRTDDAVYHFRFLDTAPEAEEREWSNLVKDARNDLAKYFREKWTVQDMEELRIATINHYYDNASPPPPPTVTDLDERARDEVARWVSDDDPHHAQYLEAVRARLAQEATDPTPGQPFHDGDDPPRSAKQREIDDREGEANNLFVWRLAVVHLRMLHEIGVSEDAPQVTTCFEMDALVQALAHMLKYRRCVRWAKCIYKSAGVGSLHDQYAAGLLNKKCAHQHQDESSTEVGIARRMIRQAHVANYVHYQYTKPKRKAAPDAADVRCVVGVKLGEIYRTESYYTNPPMAPILCSAPPRMGTTATSLLMASFAIKLGGNVQYGVWPNKAVAVAEVQTHLRSLNWFALGIGDAMRVYAYNENSAVGETAMRVHQLANNLTGWVLHIRDQAHALDREDGTAPLRTAHQENTYPLFYGLNMCVSATLIPTMGSRQLMGSDDSIRDLVVACYGADKVDRRLREQCVVLQPWSFPIGPDCLVPPRTMFPMDGRVIEQWYRNYYGSSGDRTGHYYGTWMYTTPNQEKLVAKKGVVIDNALEQAIERNQTWISAHLSNLTRDDLGQEGLYKPTDAYNTYLKNFNKHSTKYWDEQVGSFMTGGPTRVVNAPIACLTDDAAKIAQQASTWMDESSMVHINASGSKELLHPMLLTAPSKQAFHRSNDMDWAMLLCKLAWLRMHKDYVRTRIRADISPDELAERYGLTVLVHFSNRDAERLVDVVAKREDVHNIEGAQFAAVTFDPRLPENRFKNQRYEDAGLPEGRMQPSVLIPVLTPADIDNYSEAFNDAGEEGLSAYNYLRNGGTNPESFPSIRTLLYRFDMRRCYVCGDGSEGANDEPYDDEPYDDDNGGEESEGGEGDDEDVYQSDLFDLEEEEDQGNVDPDDVLDPEDVPEEPERAEEGEVEFWKPLVDDETRRGDIDPNVDDQITAMCGDDGGPGGNDPGAMGGPRITDLNGIALRLCVTGHPSTRAAAKDAALVCHIRKIAMVGYKMFETGTLQTTVRDEEQAAGDRHHYVPRYMSLASNQPEGKGRNLSELYQMIGQGFALMPGVPLPSNWKLDILASKGTRKLRRLYGNAELLLSQIRNESVEGRKMTLGTVLGTINNADGNIEYQTILDEPFKGEKNPNTGGGRFSTRSYLAVQDGYHRPFRVVRNCLSGEDAPTLADDLLTHEKNHAPNILADGLKVDVVCDSDLVARFSRLRWSDDPPVDEPMPVRSDSSQKPLEAQDYYEHDGNAEYPWDQLEDPDQDPNLDASLAEVGGAGADDDDDPENGGDDAINFLAMMDEYDPQGTGY